MSIPSVPTTTSNKLADVARWVQKEDRAVRLYDSSSEKAGLVYHECAKKNDGKQEKEKISTSDLSVVWVDVVQMPDILGEGEWPDFLKGGGVKICECQFAQKIAKGEIAGFKSVHGVTLQKTWVTIGC